MTGQRDEQEVDVRELAEQLREHADARVRLLAAAALSEPRRQRGGDRRAEARQRRNAAIRDVAELVAGKDLNLVEVANRVSAEWRRFSRRPNRTGDEPKVLAMRTIAECGCEFPKLRTLRKVLKS